MKPLWHAPLWVSQVVGFGTLLVMGLVGFSDQLIPQLPQLIPNVQTRTAIILGLGFLKFLNMQAAGYSKPDGSPVESQTSKVTTVVEVHKDTVDAPPQITASTKETIK